MGTIERILEGLSEVQKKAVTCHDGPLVVFAGAGSGKTRIITRRIAHLIHSGVHPSQILAVTFTNKAAREMKERVEALIPEGRYTLIATFHSACARWLREFAPELGFNSDYIIYDEDDTRAALKALFKTMNIKDTDVDVTPAIFMQSLEWAKSNVLFPSDLEKGYKEYSDRFPEWAVQVYKKYQESLASSNAMDFGDLIMNVILLLRRNERVRKILEHRYRYILVDEYQDTNRSQMELVARLSQQHQNLCVVGDDDQSIYSWRGASARNILDFTRAFPGALSVTLDTNFRCSGTIVKAASALISNNKVRVEKDLKSANSSGVKIGYALEHDADLEAWMVASTIIKERGEYPLTDVAIFYRTNAQSRVLEEALLRENVPYRIYGTLRFYERMEVKDLIAYLRIIINEDDAVSLRRIINVPARKIGNRALEQLEEEAGKRGLSLMKTIRALVKEQDSKQGNKLKPFYDLMVTLKSQIEDMPLDRVVDYLVATIGYKDYLAERFKEQEEERVENIIELANAISQYAARGDRVALSDWLQSVTLSDENREEADGEDEGRLLKKVSLMTLHMAKGLEYRRVYVTGLEEGLLPHQNNVDDSTLLEEERRLLYVGMTRAKEKLSLSGACRRRLYGNQWLAQRPSRFLKEIPESCLAVSYDTDDASYKETYHGDQSFGKKQDSTYERYDEYKKETYEYDNVIRRKKPTYKVGTLVFHPTYGKGVIESIDEDYGSTKALVNFPEFGRRRVPESQLTPFPEKVILRR